MINLKTLTSILEQYKLSDEQAEELQKVIYKLDDGLLFELPCKMGDTVWFIKAFFSFYPSPKSEKIERIKIADNCIELQTQSRTFYSTSIGKTVFLTREEAEKALEEVKENDKQSRN